MQYVIDEKGTFFVNNISIESGFFITITSSYGENLPEIGTMTPICSDYQASLGNIINWMERGIVIDFSSYEDILKIYLFLTEYNAYCKKENEEANMLLYKPAYNAEQMICDLIQREDKIEEKNRDENNPFIRKIPETSKKFHSFDMRKKTGKDVQQDRSQIIKGYELFDDKTKMLHDDNIVYYDDIILES